MSEHDPDIVMAESWLDALIEQEDIVAQAERILNGDAPAGSLDIDDDIMERAFDYVRRLRTIRRNTEDTEEREEAKRVSARIERYFVEG